jgi:hypothetical protein
MKTAVKIAVWAGVLALVGYLAHVETRGPAEMPLSELIDRASAKGVKTAHWRGDTVTGTLKDGTPYQARVADIESPLGYSTFQGLEFSGVEVTNEGLPASARILPLVGFLIVPLIFIFVFYHLFIKPAQTGANLSSGVSPPRGTPEERLNKIDDLHARGLVSDEERARLRERVLKEV